MNRVISIVLMLMMILTISSACAINTDYRQVLRESSYYYCEEHFNSDGEEKINELNEIIEDHNNYSFRVKYGKGKYTDAECEICGKPCAYHVYVLESEDFEFDSKDDNSEGKHPCAICGKTEGTKQINNSQIGGKWDDNWYCTEHYADAWQYYYGDKDK